MHVNRHEGYQAMERSILDSIGDSVFIISEDRNIVFANKTARKTFGIDTLESIQHEKCCDVLNFDICFDVCPAEKLPINEMAHNYNVKRNGEEIPYCMSTSILSSTTGQREGVIHTVKRMKPAGCAHMGKSTDAPGTGENDLERIEKERLIDALVAHRWKVIKASESMGYSRVTMWRRMKKYGIKLPNRR